MAQGDIHQIEIRYHIKESVLTSRLFYEETVAETDADPERRFVLGWQAANLASFQSVLSNETVIDCLIGIKATGADQNPYTENLTGINGTDGLGPTMPPQAVFMIQSLADEGANRARGHLKIRGWRTARLNNNNINGTLQGIANTAADQIMLTPFAASVPGTATYEYRVLHRPGGPSPPSWPGIPLTPTQRNVPLTVVQSKRTRNKFTGLV